MEAILINNYNPFVTAKRRKELSKPVRLLEAQGLLRGKILDYGCGYGHDSEILKDKYKILNYDKYNLQFKNDKVLSDKYDVVYSIFVFNTIATISEFEETLQLIKTLSKNIYVAVRSDVYEIKPYWRYDPENDGYWLRKGKEPSFQRFFTIESVELYFGKVDVVYKNEKLILFKLCEV